MQKHYHRHDTLVSSWEFILGYENSIFELPENGYRRGITVAAWKAAVWSGTGYLQSRNSFDRFEQPSKHRQFENSIFGLPVNGYRRGITVAAWEAAV